MTILSIETSTEVCSAALTIGGVPVATFCNREGSNHAALLPTYIQSLLATAKEQGLTIEAVALSAGPGSYTGLRIGTSTAKGLCFGLDIPLIPLDTTEVLAATFAAQAHQPVEDNAALCPMIDARRMEVYTALYDTNLSAILPVAAKIIDTESFATHLQQRPIYFFGNGADKCQPVITSPNAHFVSGIVPEAQYMGILAEQTHRRQIAGSELAYFDPLYVKEFVAAPSHVKGLN